MAGSLNKVTLIGNVGRDPEVRYTQDGKPIVNLSLATGETWKDRTTGERREKTEWHRVVIFNEPIAKVVQSYVRKGTKVYLEGQLTTREWTDQTGAKRYSTEVVLQNYTGQLLLLDSRGGGEGGESYSGGGASDDAFGGNARFASKTPVSAGVPEDDIPF